MNFGYIFLPLYMYLFPHEHLCICLFFYAAFVLALFAYICSFSKMIHVCVYDFIGKSFKQIAIKDEVVIMER